MDERIGCKDAAVDVAFRREIDDRVDLVRLKEISWRHPSGKVSNYKNTNRVLRNYAFCNGMKTGYTEASGFCLISSASNGGRSVIAVVLGDTRDAIWTDSYKLLAWGLAS